MKKVLLMLFIIPVFFACTEEELEDEIINGKAMFYKNNKFDEWECCFVYSLSHKDFSVFFKKKNEVGYDRETIRFEKFDNIFQEQYNDSLNARYYSLIADGDVLQSSYRLDTTANNYFIIDTFNESTSDVSGRFQLTMVLEEWYDWETQPEYDTIRFTEGQFETRINFLD